MKAGFCGPYMAPIVNSRTWILPLAPGVVWERVKRILHGESVYSDQS